MNIMNSFFSILVLFATSPIFADIKAETHGGAVVKNGGDSLERKFHEVAFKIEDWIRQGGSKKIIMPEGLSSDEYQKRMLKSLGSYSLRLVPNVIYVNGSQKTCENFLDPLHGAMISCSRELLAELSTHYIDFVQLVHHEFAGLAGIESNNGDMNSDYTISSQLHFKDRPSKDQVSSVRPGTLSNPPFSCAIPSGLRDQEYIRIVQRLPKHCWIYFPDVFGNQLMDSFAHSDRARKLGIPLRGSFMSVIENSNPGIDITNGEVHSWERLAKGYFIFNIVFYLQDSSRCHASLLVLDKGLSANYQNDKNGVICSKNTDMTVRLNNFYFETAL